MKKQFTFVYLLFALAASAQEVQYNQINDSTFQRITIIAEEIDADVFVQNVINDNARLLDEKYQLEQLAIARHRDANAQKRFVTDSLSLNYDSLYTAAMRARYAGEHVLRARGDALDQVGVITLGLHPNNSRLLRSATVSGEWPALNVLPVSAKEFSFRNWNVGGAAEVLEMGQVTLPNGRSVYRGVDSAGTVVVMFQR